MDRSEWDQRYSGGDLVWSADPNRFVVAEVQDLPPGRALDLGAGEGRNSLWLAARGWQVTAVDFSAAGLDKGRRLAEAHGVSVDWVLADVMDYEPDRAAYQLALLAYLQLEAPSLGRVLGHAVNALAHGGTLLVVGHDVMNLTDGVGGPQDPARLHTPEAITRELSGLKVQRAERVRRPVGDDGREAIDTLVRAVRP